MPDMLLIDGGKGQVTQALDVLANCRSTACRWWVSPRAQRARPGFETLILGDSGRRSAAAADNAACT
jgi:excinuclease ABC subunit C